MSGLLHNVPTENLVAVGEREDLKAITKRAVRALMNQALNDRVLHAEIVAAGAFEFRRVFNKDMAAFFQHNRAGCDQLANVVYDFMKGTWQKKYPGVYAGKFLDSITPVSPPTEKEIDEAWEVEIGSSESAMRQHYEGSARHRKGSDLGAVKVQPKSAKR